MADLIFFTGTMDCGKSILALQTDWTHSARGRNGILFTREDRAGTATVSSRLGLTTPAVEVTDATDFWDEVVQRRVHARTVDYLICDEVQFYRPEQVEQLARVVDELDVDVFAFGITTDFRTRLFPGSARMVELADRIRLLQVEALCWCGRRATHNARTVDGIMVLEGEQVVVGDVDVDGRRSTVAVSRPAYRRRSRPSSARWSGGPSPCRPDRSPAGSSSRAGRRRR
ncbi:thymidine kinase [Tersicoccus phoenicis]|uniref:Thymidine kinase n=1 Tax=Tersicoccus phoenicis TaxID=554083 RepID=A0A1R1LQ52_9MICC|nr:thymidine kinase [Tersicoccus phoenicis]OMH29689.1 thymidine kinase [Tersicoccus phoenicis]